MKHEYSKLKALFQINFSLFGFEHIKSFKFVFYQIVSCNEMKKLLE